MEVHDDSIARKSKKGIKQYGIYSSEFKPSFIEDNGVKKADILIFIVDEENKHLRSWVIDVKKR